MRQCGGLDFGLRFEQLSAGVKSDAVFHVIYLKFRFVVAAFHFPVHIARVGISLLKSGKDGLRRLIFLGVDAGRRNNEKREQQ